MTYTTLSGTALRFVIRGKKCITAFCLMLVPNVFNETGKKNGEEQSLEKTDEGAEEVMLLLL